MSMELIISVARGTYIPPWPVRLKDEARGRAPRGVDAWGPQAAAHGQYSYDSIAM